MQITDKKAKQILKRIDSSILMETIEAYPDDERDERSDLQFVADEVSYQVSCYNEDGHTWKDDLEEAKEKLRETKNGQFIPVDPKTFKPKYGYYPSQIDTARSIVNEYKRLVNALKRMQKDGLYGKWYIV